MPKGGRSWNRSDTKRKGPSERPGPDERHTARGATDGTWPDRRSARRLRRISAPNSPTPETETSGGESTGLFDDRRDANDGSSARESVRKIRGVVSRAVPSIRRGPSRVLSAWRKKVLGRISNRHQEMTSLGRSDPRSWRRSPEKIFRRDSSPGSVSEKTSVFDDANPTTSRPGEIPTNCRRPSRKPARGTKRSTAMEQAGRKQRGETRVERRA